MQLSDVTMTQFARSVHSAEKTHDCHSHQLTQTCALFRFAALQPPSNIYLYTTPRIIDMCECVFFAIPAFLTGAAQPVLGLAILFHVSIPLSLFCVEGKLYMCCSYLKLDVEWVVAAVIVVHGRTRQKSVTACNSSNKRMGMSMRMLSITCSLLLLLELLLVAWPKGDDVCSSVEGEHATLKPHLAHPWTTVVCVCRLQGSGDYVQWTTRRPRAQTTHTHTQYATHTVFVEE